MKPDAVRRSDRTEAGSLALDGALAGLAVLALGISLCVPPGALPALPLCPFRELTGLPCPGCGMTRAFCAIGHGEFGKALALNPFSFVFYGAALALLGWPLARRRFPGALARVVQSRWFAGLPLALVLAMWAFGAWRIWRALP